MCDCGDPKSQHFVPKQVPRQKNGSMHDVVCWPDTWSTVIIVASYKAIHLAGSGTVAIYS